MKSIQKGITVAAIRSLVSILSKYLTLYENRFFYIGLMDTFTAIHTIDRVCFILYEWQFMASEISRTADYCKYQKAMVTSLISGKGNFAHQILDPVSCRKPC